jgi:hypothetical protein
MSPFCDLRAKILKKRGGEEGEEGEEGELRRGGIGQTNLWTFLHHSQEDGTLTTVVNGKREENENLETTPN